MASDPMNDVNMDVDPLLAYDDDIIPLDDEPVQQTIVPEAPVENGDETMEVDDMDKNTPEKIYVHGVDEMSTAQVENWAYKGLKTVEQIGKIKKVEWIDDSSCRFLEFGP